MSHVPHDLHEDFPGQADRISVLKQQDRHFAQLVERYHDINREVHRAETLVAPMADHAESELRRSRALLKDQIRAALRG
ncbi:YdcH family protein [Salipiger marinus]|jgi:uncharacterized protein|uniref:DUF465 domain-containing protein n=1 Tax=Salipiger marinus TaxID=555512 RepID=A0A1G8JJR9_9RHOB|nr:MULTISPECIES: DUF465 domain-containing protein [Salipiger]HBM58457.1 DUF465 domain-containing protein [Citreicella sp.]MCD1619921.1 DUF465 domain-containing protein [Salipiger manganoxidans]MEB3420868.1 DUF465 domain-containing protein [Salipiger manganoxidans]SDI31341.1 hypothetical protein SAMN04487993_100395 [Salipiger marinus]HBT02817.1 DUF465 domain-containing protein [Citreicella sp.]|tara:strand:+ start:256 stop:492 length:237 start_codon:yes stop_codon:yes gene_type:complete